MSRRRRIAGGVLEGSVCLHFPRQLLLASLSTKETSIKSPTDRLALNTSDAAVQEKVHSAVMFKKFLFTATIVSRLKSCSSVHCNLSPYVATFSL